MFSAFDQRLIREFAPWANIVGHVMESLASSAFSGTFDERRLCDHAGLPATQTPAVIGILKKLQALGFVTEYPEMQWRVTGDVSTLIRLAPSLEAIGFYRENIHLDETTASIVLTRPGQPSQLEATLSSMGFTTGRMEVTSEAFSDIALSARKRLVVMTPFLDQHGAKWLSGLLHKTKPTVQKAVILRYLKKPEHPSYPDGFVTLGPTLAELGVKVFDYAIPRPAGIGMETFHAKVILADDDYAYVGSANMNKASLEHSMELGILVKGEAARTVAQIVEAIMRMCS